MHNVDADVYLKDVKDKPAVYALPVFGMSTSSLLSTDEVELKIVPKLVKVNNYFVRLRYYIELTNKSNSNIYIDKANCFKIDHENKATSYYDSKQVNVSEGRSSGGAINLGGITSALGVGGVVGTLADHTTVGGSSTGTVTTSYSQQRIIVIPPHSKAYLSEYEEAHIKGSKYKLISDGEYWEIPKGLLRRGTIKRNEKISYTEETSPLSYQYVVTYSTQQDFSTYSNLRAKIFMKELYGEDYNPNSPSSVFQLGHSYYTIILGESEDKALEKLKKNIKNFDLNKNILLGYDSELQK